MASQRSFEVAVPNGEPKVYEGFRRPILTTTGTIIGMVEIDGEFEVWEMDNKLSAIELRRYYQETFGMNVVVYCSRIDQIVS